MQWYRLHVGFLHVYHGKYCHNLTRLDNRTPSSHSTLHVIFLHLVGHEVAGAC